MPSGLVITNGYTVVYSLPKEENRYVSTSATTDTEMEYLGTEVEEDYSGKKIFWAKVQYADRIGYVKLDKVTLKPYVLLTNRSYYSVTNGELKHTIFYNSTNREASYIIGKAPSSLLAGKNITAGMVILSITKIIQLFQGNTLITISSFLHGPKQIIQL